MEIEETDSDVESVASPARKPEAGKKRKREGEKEVDGDKDGEDGRRTGDVKGKGKTPAVQEMVGKKRKVDEDTWSDDDDELEEDDKATKKVIVVARGGHAGEESQAPKPKRIRAPPKGTGEYHEPPCEYCRTVSKRPCEKDAGGGACVACKQGKRACDYSHGKNRKRPRPVSGSDAEPAQVSAPAKARVVRAARAAPGQTQSGLAGPGPSQPVRSGPTVTLDGPMAAGTLQNPSSTLTIGGNVPEYFVC
jgi:hypothetical protein